MRILLRLFITGLVNGNPIAWAILLIIGIPTAGGYFREGIAKRDPGAIGLMALLVVLALILIVVAIVDRKLNPKPKAKAKKKKKKASPGPAEYVHQPRSLSQRPK